jgi:F0F1-type ATP synthase assembly protein I
MTDSKSRSRIKAYVLYGSLGLSLCTEIVVAGLVGWFLGSAADRRWGLKPWGSLIGIFLFLGVAFFHLMRTLAQISRRLEKEEDSPNGP